jgi:LacI family transcriptional regulator
MRNVKKRRVALAFPQGIAFVERILQGILDYARKQGGWVFTRMPERLSPSLDWLQHWPGNGAFALVTTVKDARLVKQLSIPVVNLAGYLETLSLPTVMVDHLAVGRLAAEHLLERRFQRYGYYGPQKLLYSETRLRGFREILTKNGCTCSVLAVPTLSPTRREWADEQADLKHWLGKLLPPVGILASTDLRASMVLDACAELGLRVPRDIAVVGVDNDPVVCEFTQPTLSSVSRNDWEVGHQAARLLDKLMSGSVAPQGPELVPPDGVIERGSTDTLAIEDPEVENAINYIRAHLHEPFGVERLLAQSHLSRRSLEHRFRQAMGCSPYVLINQLRVERAKQLLGDAKKQTLTEIALSCGFTELRRFRLVFQKLAGQSPAEYRLHHLTN